MTTDPCQRFLGVAWSSDPETLLGVPPGTEDAATIEGALRGRLAQLYHHPDGRSDEAEDVRRHLRRVAQELIGSLRQPRQASSRARSQPQTITEFDRHVLAVLIGCGGWNAATRARLVGLAAAYGVSVDGLVKVVVGLSEHARSGGPRLELAQITAGQERVSAPPATAPAIGGEPEVQQWLARVAPELRETGPVSTIKLSLFFGLVTLLAALLAVRILFAPDPSRPRPQLGPPSTLVGEARRAPRPPRRELPTPPPAPTMRIASFPQMPGFLGHALSAEAAQAADECPDLPAHLESLSRRITVSDEPSEAVFRHWGVSLRTAGLGWVLIDDSLHESITQTIFGALYAASDSPSVTDRLLAELTPPSGRLAEPTDVWRGAWAAGMLGRIASSSGLPPAVVERARIQLDLALGDRLAAGPSFEAAARAWLGTVVDGLVDVMDFSPGAYDFWECWIAAQRRLGRGLRFDESVMDAIGAVLATSTDLARQGPGANVLGRLLTLADFDSSPIVRDRFVAFFDDEQRVRSRDLWVVTSLLATYDPAPWFSEDLVVPEDADWIFRRRLADRISRRWPPIEMESVASAASVGGVPVDSKLAARWLAAFAADQDRPAGHSSEQMLERLVMASRLNEVACRLAAGDSDAAERLLESIEEPAEPPGARGGRGPRKGQPGRGSRRGGPIGPDGEWALAYEQAGHNIEEKLGLLGELRSAAGSDLGPIDADIFVRTVYRGTRQDIRGLASTILIEQFTGGPNVALEMLGQFANAPRSENTSETIRRYTGSLLPAARSDSWKADARLALVEHALWLLNASGDRIERQMELVCESYLNRRASLEPRWTASAASSATWQEAVGGLIEAWRRRAAAASERDNELVASELGELQPRYAARLRLADGPLQGFVAGQLAIVDLVAYTIATAQPSLRRPVQGLVADSARRRSRASHVLEQALEAERVVGRLWHLQMVVEDDG